MHRDLRPADAACSSGRREKSCDVFSCCCEECTSQTRVSSGAGNVARHHQCEFCTFWNLWYMVIMNRPVANKAYLCRAYTTKHGQCTAFCIRHNPNVQHSRLSQHGHDAAVVELVVQDAGLADNLLGAKLAVRKLLAYDTVAGGNGGSSVSGGQRGDELRKGRLCALPPTHEIIHHMRVLGQVGG